MEVDNEVDCPECHANGDRELTGAFMTLKRMLAQFDLEDVKELDAALKRFVDYKGSSGLPDWSPNFVAYTPVLVFALLKTQSVLQVQTWAVVVLTLVLAVLAAVQIGLLAT